MDIEAIGKGLGKVSCDKTGRCGGAKLSVRSLVTTQPFCFLHPVFRLFSGFSPNETLKSQVPAGKLSHMDGSGRRSRAVLGDAVPGPNPPDGQQGDVYRDVAFLQPLCIRFSGSMEARVTPAPARPGCPYAIDLAKVSLVCHPTHPPSSAPAPAPAPPGLG